jgi:hypothetical protein
MDTRDDEKERGITIKSTAISMFFAMDKEELGAVSQTSNGEFRGMSLEGIRLSEEGGDGRNGLSFEDESGNSKRLNFSQFYAFWSH